MTSCPRPQRDATRSAYRYVVPQACRWIDFAATTGAETRWRRLGCRSVEEARAQLVSHIRRTVGIAAARSSARLVAWRIGTVGSARLPRAARARRGPVDPAAHRDAVSAADLAADLLDSIAWVRPPHAA